MRYFIYHLRWQLSALVMFPVIYFLKQWIDSEFIRLCLGQAFGAVLFYMVDKRIFKPKENES